MQKTAIQRKYKDRLFRMAFREKRHLLALYNAINSSSYEDPQALEIRTLEDVIYMGMKNDASFILDDVISLWEHQSSFNPNMPIRGLGYFARLYQNYIQEHKINVYSSKLQPLPFPQYIVLYNGLQKEPDRTELKLSDAFVRNPTMSDDRQPCLEVRATMLNINWGHNQELMEQCQRLREYSQCIAIIREHEKLWKNREEAISKAIDQCIAKGLLADVLLKNKSEVITLFLTEYDEQAQRELDREEAREEGLEQGKWIQIILSTEKKMKKGLPAETAADMLEAPAELIRQIYDAFQAHPGWTAKEIYESLSLRSKSF